MTDNASLFTEFMEMLDRCGITPTGTRMERYSKERDVMTMLEQVRDFPVERLPEIEAWIKENGKVRRPDTVILEMQARLAQSRPETAPERWTDEQIDAHERQLWERVQDMDRDALPRHAQERYDSLRERYATPR